MHAYKMILNTPEVVFWAYQVAVVMLIVTLSCLQAPTYGRQGPAKDWPINDIIVSLHSLIKYQLSYIW